MTTDRDRRHLNYIRDSIALIQLRTARGRDELLHDIDMQDAVLWRLETLAEATGKLSTDLKLRHPEIRWEAVRGFRNIVAHGYLDLNLDLVWEIIEVHLPDLKTVIDQELRSE